MLSLYVPTDVYRIKYGIIKISVTLINITEQFFKTALCKFTKFSRVV